MNLRTFHCGSAIRVAEGTRFSQFTPVGDNFGSACDQIDRAEVMLAGLHQRVKQGLATLGRPTRTCRSAEHAADSEIELELSAEISMNITFETT